jgi:hypothetical protein
MTGFCSGWLAQPAGFCHIRRWMNWPASPQTQYHSILLGVPDAGHHISHYPERLPRPTKPFWIRRLLRHGLQNAWHVFLVFPQFSPSHCKTISYTRADMAMLHLGDVDCLILFH